MEIMEEKQVEYWKDLENTEENCEMIQKYGRKVSWTVKRYGKCRGLEGWIVKRFGKYRRKPSWIVIRFGKYRRKLWKDREKIVKWFGKYGRKKSWIVKWFGK
jgi:hypothetical protein